MNYLPAAESAQILSMLCEGSFVRPVSRVADASVNTVAKLLADAGNVFTPFHGKAVRGMGAKRVQCDENWCGCCARQTKVAGAKAAPEQAGDIWPWTALDADHVLIIGYLVGGRDAGCAAAFVENVAGRLGNRVQLTTHGCCAYLDAGEGAFGCRYRLSDADQGLRPSAGAC